MDLSIKFFIDQILHSIIYYFDEDVIFKNEDNFKKAFFSLEQKIVSTKLIKNKENIENLNYYNMKYIFFA